MSHILKTTILFLFLCVVVGAVSAEMISDVIDAGMVGLTVNNQGLVGHAFSSRDPNCEYPLFSNTEHLYQGGFWVGARTGDGSAHVSITTQDINGIVSLDEIREFNEYNDPSGSPSFRSISNNMNSMNYHPDALAAAHVECIFKDNAILESGDHVPLGLKVTQRSLAWSQYVYDDFVIFDYTVTNTSQNTLYDVYVGFFNDTTVGNTELTNPYDYGALRRWNYNDDLNGAWRPGDFASDPSLWMMHEHDDDGDEGHATSWVGCRLLGTEPQVVAPVGKPPVSYNSWRFRGVPDQDDWYEDVAEPGTMLPGKYQIMSNGHFDVGVTPEGDFSPASNWLGILSTGPFPELNPGESVRVVFALTLGPNEELLRYHSRLAKLLYDNNYELQVASEPDVPAFLFSMGPAVPNPFNPSTTLSFSLAKAGPVRMTVHDLKGGLVRVLVDEHRGEGPHSAVWDGRNDHGRAAASGTYLIRLLSDGQSATTKVVLNK